MNMKIREREIMEWTVCDVITLKDKGCYALNVKAESLEMIAQITSKLPLHIGDVLYPTYNAMYMINRDKNHLLMVTSACDFTVDEWNLIKRCRQ